MGQVRVTQALAQLRWCLTFAPGTHTHTRPPPLSADALSVFRCLDSLPPPWLAPLPLTTNSTFGSVPSDDMTASYSISMKDSRRYWYAAAVHEYSGTAAQRYGRRGWFRGRLRWLDVQRAMPCELQRAVLLESWVCRVVAVAAVRGSMHYFTWSGAATCCHPAQYVGLR